MFKGIDSKWGWAAGGMGLACIGIGAILFSRVTGVFLVFIGLLVCWLWYSRYAKKKPVVKPAAPPALPEPKALTDAEAAALYKKEHNIK